MPAARSDGFIRLRPVAAALVVAAVLAPSIRAQTVDFTEPPHVRSETQAGRALLGALVEKSPTARALVDELDQSTVVVYIRYRMFTTPLFEGRIGLVSWHEGRRYLVLELPCGRIRVEQLRILAHELFHATEIARAPGIVDTRTLSAHYGRIGMRLEGSPDHEMFETQGAIEMTSRVRHELFAPVSTANTRRFVGDAPK